MKTASDMLDEYIDSLCDCLGSLYAGGNENNKRYPSVQTFA